jgi:hypothetical protein
VRKAGLTFAAAAIAALVVATGARAEDRITGWLAGGSITATSFEQRLTSIATEIAGHASQVVCTHQDDWPILTRYWGREPNAITGLGFNSWVFIHPSYCPALETLAGSPQRRGIKECAMGVTTQMQTETRTETRTVPHRGTVVEVVKKRVKKKGRWTWANVRRTRVVTTYEQVSVEVQVQVPVQVPVYGTCPSYAVTYFAVALLTHEAEHSWGTRVEAEAECRALQHLARTAMRLGVAKDFALELAADNLARYMRLSPSSAYWSADCRDGGPMDLNPGLEGWPVPASTLA